MDLIGEYEIQQGATFRLHLECYSDDNALMNFAEVAEVRATVRNGSELIATFAASVVAAGTLEVYLTPAETAALAPGRYTWDCEVEFDSGDVDRVLGGIADVSAENTYV